MRFRVNNLVMISVGDNEDALCEYEHFGADSAADTVGGVWPIL